MPHFSLCYCGQLLSVKMATLAADNQNLLKSLLQSPCADSCTNTYCSTYKPHGTTYSSFPELPYVFRTWSFTSLLHRLFSLLGMTFPPSFLSSWKDLMFLPRLKSSVMSPMGALPDQIICLFLRGTIASEQTSSPYTESALKALAAVYFIFASSPSIAGQQWLAWQQMLIMLVECACMNRSPNQGLQTSGATTSTAGPKQKWISGTSLDSKVVILYSFIGSSYSFVVIAGETTSEQLSPPEWIQEDSL